MRSKCGTFLRTLDLGPQNFAQTTKHLVKLRALGLNWLKLYLSIASERSDEVNLQKKSETCPNSHTFQ